LTETGVTKEGFSLTISVDELKIINNALNEVCHGIHMDDSEFRVRMGVTRQQARTLLDQLHEILRRASEAGRS
jgi:hypothetical protein